MGRGDKCPAQRAATASRSEMLLQRCARSPRPPTNCLRATASLPAIVRSFPARIAPVSLGNRIESRGRWVALARAHPESAACFLVIPPTLASIRPICATGSIQLLIPGSLMLSMPYADSLAAPTDRPQFERAGITRSGKFFLSPGRRAPCLLLWGTAARHALAVPFAFPRLAGATQKTAQPDTLTHDPPAEG